MSNNVSSQNKPSLLHALPWDSEHLEDSLDQVYQFAVQEAKQAIKWYGTKSRPKKRWAQILRVAAILATALAGIIPMLSKSMPNGWLDPLWASVAVALAATALGLDRFFGFSTAWMRFITSELKIKSRLQNFQFEWEAARISWQGKRPSYDQAQAMLSRAANFTGQVSNIVEEETHAWIKEFQSVLTSLDESLKVKAKRSELGAVMVNVENGDQCDEAWTLVIAGQAAQTYWGKSGMVNDVYPGLHKVTATGTIANKPVQAQAMAQVFPGETAKISLTLSKNIESE